ncbi:MAG: glycine--tRNA ligase subunit alpha, partial [Terriglobia bacterium]
AFLQNVNNVFDVMWNKERKYGELRLQEELELSVYDFDLADAQACREMFDLNEREALRLLETYPGEKEDAAARRRFPLLAIFEYCLKCSHLFNILDARGAISVTERVALIARIRRLSCRVASLYVERNSPVLEAQTA